MKRESGGRGSDDRALVRMVTGDWGFILSEVEG
jgi:hypothetical protein